MDRRGLQVQTDVSIEALTQTLSLDISVDADVSVSVVLFDVAVVLRLDGKNNGG